MSLSTVTHSGGGNSGRTQRRRLLSLHVHSPSDTKREGGASTQSIVMENDLKPNIGMEFDTIEEAWKFWGEYGKRIGFGVRRMFTNKSWKDGSITTCGFVCCKEGMREKDKRYDDLYVNHQAETRTIAKL